jgi:hypothetical protein
MFLCSQQHTDYYTECVIRGKEKSSQSNVLVCGIVRNSERILPYTISRIESLGSLFNSYHVFLYENDSIDDTKKILCDWSQENNRVAYETDTLNPPPFTDPKGYDRRKYMSFARNKYLEYARNYGKSNRIDYIIVLDCDLIGGWSYHGILNTIGQATTWDVVGSNSLCYLNHDDTWVKVFYDSWAFRPLDHPEEIDGAETNLFVFHRGEPMIRVNSCFGGMAIYKPHCITEGLNYTDEDCDHPTLHNELKRMGYNIYLNPGQITLYNKSQYVI